MSSRDWALMVLESQAVSARMTKYFVTILVHHVIIEGNSPDRTLPWMQVQYFQNPELFEIQILKHAACL